MERQISRQEAVTELKRLYRERWHGKIVEAIRHADWYLDMKLVELVRYASDLGWGRRVMQTPPTKKGLGRIFAPIVDTKDLLTDKFYSPLERRSGKKSELTLVPTVIPKREPPQSRGQSGHPEWKMDSKEAVRTIRELQKAGRSPEEISSHHVPPLIEHYFNIASKYVKPDYYRDNFD